MTELSNKPLNDCLYLADPATSLACLPYFSSESSLFIQLWEKVHISDFVLSPH